jgi:GNAT superfamily N-acetyltransferase
MARISLAKDWQLDDEELNDKFSLWYSDLEEAGIKNVFIAEIDGKTVGFLTGNIDNRCVAVEVLPEYQGLGIATQLVEASGCYRPERNGNHDFWEKMAEYFLGEE